MTRRQFSKATETDQATHNKIVSFIRGVLVLLFHLSTVQTVRDIGEIPRGIPGLVSPHLVDLTFELITSALAISLIIVVQGEGVSQSAPNPDGSARQPLRDFVEQGAANIASGFLRGLPRAAH